MRGPMAEVEALSAARPCLLGGLRGDPLLAAHVTLSFIVPINLCIGTATDSSARPPAKPSAFEAFILRMPGRWI